MHSSLFFFLESLAGGHSLVLFVFFSCFQFDWRDASSYPECGFDAPYYSLRKFFSAQIFPVASCSRLHEDWLPPDEPVIFNLQPAPSRPSHPVRSRPSAALSPCVVEPRFLK